MKLRANPLFPANLQNLTVALGQYWRELATALNGLLDGSTAGTEGLHIGNQDQDGSWRLMIVGANLEIQKRESGAWVTKDTITP